MAERAYPELRGPNQVKCLNLIDDEYGPLRATMSWALSAGHTEIAVRLGWALWMFWWLRGHKQEGGQWMETLLERHLSSSQRTIALAVTGQLGYTQGDYESGERYLQESLGLARQTDDPVRVAHAVYVLGLLSLRRQDLEKARSRLEEALSLFLQVGRSDASTVSRRLGVLAHPGRPRPGHRCDGGGARTPRKLGDRLGISNGLYNLAQVGGQRRPRTGCP